MVDKKFEDQVVDLYASLTEEMSYDGAADALARELREKEDLDDIVHTLEQLAQAISVELVAPTEIVGWLPEVAANWSQLSALEQDEIMFLHRVNTLVKSAYENRFTAAPPSSSE